MARELLNIPNESIIAVIEDDEFVIDRIKRCSTQANDDDKSTYIKLLLRDGGNGNIKR